MIENSLFEAGIAAGISDAVTMNMAGIFQWDIDFIQDVRVDDEFTVIHEELWRDGIKLRDGEIVAAEFINRGTSYRAARFVRCDWHVRTTLRRKDEAYERRSSERRSTSLESVRVSISIGAIRC